MKPSILARLFPLVAIAGLAACEPAAPTPAPADDPTVATADTASPVDMDEDLAALERQALAERRARAAADPVVGVMERAEICIHFGGEEPFDDARRAQIDRAFTDNGCDTVVADADALKARRPQDAARLDDAVRDLRP